MTKDEQDRCVAMALAFKAGDHHAGPELADLLAEKGDAATVLKVLDWLIKGPARDPEMRLVDLIAELPTKGNKRLIIMLTVLERVFRLGYTGEWIIITRVPEGVVRVKHLAELESHRRARDLNLDCGPALWSQFRGLLIPFGIKLGGATR